MNIVRGMRVRIGKGPQTSSHAVGVLFRVNHAEPYNGYDYHKGKPMDTFFLSGDVEEDPNGWGSHTVNHTYNPDVDTIVYGDNEDMLVVLNKEEDEVLPPIPN